MPEITHTTPPWTWGRFEVVHGRPGVKGMSTTGYRVQSVDTGQIWGWGDTEAAAMADAEQEILRFGSAELFQDCRDQEGRARA